MDAPEFELWIEFEHTQPSENPADEFANVEVRLKDGREYALNVWTFEFMRRARYPWPYKEGVGEKAEFLLPPDLLVERIDRPTFQRVFSRLILSGEMRSEWLVPPEIQGTRNAEKT